MMDNRKFYIWYLLITLILIISWELFSNYSSKVNLLVSSPSESFQYFIDNYTNIIQATYTTFIESFFGLMIALLTSSFLVVLCMIYPKLLKFIMPIMITSQVIPLITLAPLFIVLFGNGILPKIMMSSVLSFFPIFINSINGIKQINPNFNDIAKLYNASSYMRIKKITIPSILPYVFTGIKIASTLSVIGAIVGEFSGAEYGLGRNLFVSSIRLEPELMMNSLFFSSILGISMYQLINLIEKRFFINA